MLDKLNSIFRSLNFKILVFAVVLLIILLLLVVKAMMIRSQKMERLTSINRQIIPEEKNGYSISWKKAFPELAEKQPTAAMEKEESAASPRGKKEEASEGGDEYLDQAELNEIIYAFNNFHPDGRRDAEKKIFDYFMNMIKKSESLEKKGKGHKAGIMLRGFFEKIGTLGHPYRFEENKARDQLTTDLNATWRRLPFMSQWACLRMMGFVRGKDMKPSLLSAIKAGIFEDEAALALLRTGDTRAVPVLVDYMSRRQVKGARYAEIVEVIREMRSPDVISTLINFMGSTDGDVRFVALKLMNSLAPQVLNPPQGSFPDDADLRQKWEEWWTKAKSSYPSYAVEVPQITKLTLITGLNALPAEGNLSRAYFRKLSGEIEDCCRDLRSRELETHRRGEIALYELCRRMVDDYESNGRDVRSVVGQYMQAFAEEAADVCLMQVFPDSPEREEFFKWAGEMLQRREDSQVVVFIVRILGIVGNEKVVEVIRPVMDSGDEVLVSTAIVAMGKLGSPQVADGLRAMLDDKDIFPAAGRELVVALERVGNKKAIAYLILTMREAPPVIAYDAYLALRRIRGKWVRALSLEEFEQARKPVTEDYLMWLRKGVPQEKQ